MAFNFVALAISVLIGAYNKNRADRDRRDLRRERRKSGARDVRTPSGAVYSSGFGRCILNGIPVFPAVSDKFPQGPSASRRFGSVPINNDGANREYLNVEYDLSIGDLQDIKTVVADGYSFGAVTANSRFKSGAGYCVAEAPDYGTASPMSIAFNGPQGTNTGRRDSDSKHSFKTYVSAVFRYNPVGENTPLWGGSEGEPPFLQGYCLGNKVRSIAPDGTVDSTRRYSSNPIEVFYEYLTNTKYGPTSSGDLSPSKIGTESFGRASSRIHTIRGPGQDIGSMALDQDAQTNFGYGSNYNYGLWHDEYDSNIDWSGYLDNQWFPDEEDPAMVDVLHYEFNGEISTAEVYEDVLHLVLGVIPGYLAYERSGDGLFEVDIPDWTRTAEDQTEFTVDSNSLVNETSFAVQPPGSQEKVTQVSVIFGDVDRDGAENKITFPPDGSHWHDVLLAANNGKQIHKEFRVVGIDNIYHARQWAANTIRISHRPTVQWRMLPIGRILNPGVIVRCLDPSRGIDLRVRLEEVSEDVVTRNVTWTAREFVASDYAPVVDADDELNLFGDLPEVTALTSIIVTTSGGVNTIIATDDNPGAFDEGVEFQAIRREITE